jgi:UDP-N-acetylglucosamine diphosphorylase/glucosamine-1-phosphate N-acetyltransferase
MKLVIFDDYPIQFYPISLTRSIGDIRCGVLKLRQRLQALLFGEEEIVFIENSLVPWYQERHPDWQINTVSGDTLFVNSRLRFSPEIIAKIKDLKENQGIQEEAGVLIAFRKNIIKPVLSFSGIKEQSTGVEMLVVKDTLYQNMADIIMDNARMIEFDFEQFFNDTENYAETELGVTLLNPYKIWIGEGAMLKPGVVIDASAGPVIIDEKAEVMAHAVIMGPAYVGKGSRIKVGAKIYGGTSIGPVCKIGGEVEGSIIQAYSNKQHDGFLGHAFVGEWVNLGADTNNSDLKNNYKPVAFYSYAAKDKMQSGYQFLGSIIADHTKTGINCSLNTGVVIGVGCNLWGSTLISDHIPSFSWGEAGKLTPYKPDAFIETAKTVKQRRNLEMSEAEVALFVSIRQHEQ